MAIWGWERLNKETKEYTRYLERRKNLECAKQKVGNIGQIRKIRNFGRVRIKGKIWNTLEVKERENGIGTSGWCSSRLAYPVGHLGAFDLAGVVALQGVSAPGVHVI